MNHTPPDWQAKPEQDRTTVQAGAELLATVALCAFCALAVLVLANVGPAVSDWITGQ